MDIAGPINQVVVDPRCITDVAGTVEIGLGPNMPFSQALLGQSARQSHRVIANAPIDGAWSSYFHRTPARNLLIWWSWGACSQCCPGRVGASGAGSNCWAQSGNMMTVDMGTVAVLRIRR